VPSTTETDIEPASTRWRDPFQDDIIRIGSVSTENKSFVSRGTMDPHPLYFLHAQCLQGKVGGKTLGLQVFEEAVDCTGEPYVPRSDLATRGFGDIDQLSS
jgi:hypothetical protein